MRFYTETHQHYCGIDLHARTMYVCILDREGQVLLHRNLPCDPERFLRAIAPIARTWSSPSSASSPRTVRKVSRPETRTIPEYWRLALSSPSAHL